MATTAIDRAAAGAGLSTAAQIAVKTLVRREAWELYDAILAEQGNDVLLRIKVPLIGLKLVTVRVRDVAAILELLVRRLVGPRLTTEGGASQ